ncbi:hypothetical protein GALMADRAFT_144192 [Galerina marginata CBS 339.88]|uniref:Uncharacterized protein n=1 Tax=Galerina marginata (strain CBS 339.88) TaxID=685588 RepID=A0A067SM57_GALM3|nr:hypothetical protein GALMADRAFT_144192 [Galerina marginata CBS 339.88]
MANVRRALRMCLISPPCRRGRGGHSASTTTSNDIDKNDTGHATVDTVGRPHVIDLAAAVTLPSPPRTTLTLSASQSPVLHATPPVPCTLGDHEKNHIACRGDSTAANAFTSYIVDAGNVVSPPLLLSSASSTAVAVTLALPPRTPSTFYDDRQIVRYLDEDDSLWIHSCTLTPIWEFKPPTSEPQVALKTPSLDMCMMGDHVILCEDPDFRVHNSTHVCTYLGGPSINAFLPFCFLFLQSQL